MGQVEINKQVMHFPPTKAEMALSTFNYHARLGLNDEPAIMTVFLHHIMVGVKEQICDRL